MSEANCEHGERARYATGVRSRFASFGASALASLRVRALASFGAKAVPLAALTLLSGAAAAAPLWQQGARLPDQVRSVQILREGEPMWTAPDRRAPRRGTARLGAHLPVYSTRSGPGCAGKWINVGPMAWLCELDVALSAAPPLTEEPPRVTASGLPFDYFFAGADGAFGYGRLSQADLGAPSAQYEPGMSVALVRTQTNALGELFGLTTKGFWFPMRELNPARPLGFGAEELNGELDVLWVYQRTASLHDKPEGRRTGTLSQFESARYTEVVVRSKRRWFKTPHGWVSEREVRAPTPSEPPEEARPDERWIDVELEQQVITAYQGRVPVFSALASTGRGRGKSEMATPVGVHRVWVKLRTGDMDNLENEYAGRYYAIEEVPWVLYFKRGYGLHGTFWHRRFGNKQSHGCVNLTPRAAERLYHWSSPKLPAGWTAALPTAYEPGTLVRVR
ncbi:MAG: L,D-transpeptidase [Polyangiaceae bacterium]|nr:L,D-transpeptidase [Polyangiaceae bacterium]MCW5792229.1 L,D-transpeptidase [Polyangiaceae bacterium]